MNGFLFALYFMIGLVNPESDRMKIVEKFTAEKKEASAVLAYTSGYRAIRIFYFPGSIDSNALIVGGIHGSELSSTELAWSIIEKLSAGVRPRYNTWVIPSLFPDNEAEAAAVPTEIGSTKNIGRLTRPDAADPNRQMPAPGKAFDQLKPFDNTGQPIEMENRLLLELFQLVKPARVAMLHAIRNISQAGIFADPRTDCAGYALGYSIDSSIAIQTAGMIAEMGGNVNGNHLQSGASSLYYLDPAIALPGKKQKRNLKPGPSGFGVSMGTWGSTAVCQGDEAGQRGACILFTVEFPGSRRPVDYVRADERRNCVRNMKAYASALCMVFLDGEENG